MIRTACKVAAAVATTTTLLVARPTLTKAMSSTTATGSNSLPTLKGVVFDMDDTLVRANLNIPAMYKAVFGTDPSEDSDILKEINAIADPDEKSRAYQIVETIEEKSRQQMTLMPGCTEVLTWLSHHNIPRALVTRNSKTTADVFCETLALSSGLSFERAITRDDANKNETKPIPFKPDPTAMNILAEECFECDTSEIIMVGDSVSNDVAFGKNAGTHTALLVDADENNADENSNRNRNRNGAADICVSHLTELPKNLWKSFRIAGPIGNTPEEANQRPLHGSPPPKPQSDLCVAVANGNVEAVRAILENNNSLDELVEAEESNGNTALIWACETGNATIASLLLSTIATRLSENCGENKDTQNQRMSSHVNHRGFLGATALNRAARRGHTHVLKLLLEDDNDDEWFVDKDLPNNKLQYPLHFAAFKKNPDALRYLLEKGANPWVLDRKGRTPVEDTSCEICKSILFEAMK